MGLYKALAYAAQCDKCGGVFVDIDGHTLYPSKTKLIKALRMRSWSYNKEGLIGGTTKGKITCDDCKEWFVLTKEANHNERARQRGVSHERE